MIKVLQGVKVVEQGTFITGPAAGMLLGDLGADVIKVEVPETGDPFRAFKGGLYSPHFQTYNRNKRSITLDTKDAADRAVFDALIADADVYIQNFRPGVADKLGVGEERLRALNPRLVYCSISGFGATGPGRQPAGLRHRRAGGERLPEPARQPREPARRRPGDRRCADRLLRRLRRARRADRARPHRRRPHRRGLDARGDGALQPRRLHALLPGRRGDGAVQPAERVAVVRARVRRRQVDRAAHVVAGEVLARPGGRDRAARPLRRRALRDPRGAHREPGGADRAARRALQAPHARRLVRAAASARTCRTRRCTTPAKRSTIRRRCTCS